MKSSEVKYVWHAFKFVAFCSLHVFCIRRFDSAISFSWGIFFDKDIIMPNYALSITLLSYWLLISLSCTSVPYSHCGVRLAFFVFALSCFWPGLASSGRISCCGILDPVWILSNVDTFQQFAPTCMFTMHWSLFVTMCNRSSTMRSPVQCTSSQMFNAVNMTAVIAFVSHPYCMLCCVCLQVVDTEASSLHPSLTLNPLQ